MYMCMYVVVWEVQRHEQSAKGVIISQQLEQIKLFKS